MSSTSTTNECVYNITIAVNNSILYELAVKTLNNANANNFRDLLVRTRTDTELLDAIKDFSKSFMDLNGCLSLSAFSIASVSRIKSISSTVSASLTTNASSTASSDVTIAYVANPNA